jgi:hypothetical protein
MNSFLDIAESLLLLLALPMSPKSKAATGSNASIKCWNLDRAMSNARAYMMVYRLSVVSEYHFVLVMNEGRSGGNVASQRVTCWDTVKADGGCRGCAANVMNK